MNVKKMMILMIVSAMFFMGCETPDDDDDNYNDVSIDKAEPVILFSYTFEDNGPKSDIQILNGDNQFNPFSDNIPRTNPSLSPDKSKIVYLYNYPSSGGITENPVVKYYDFVNKAEIEILTLSDSIFYYNPVWISESLISVEKFEMSKTSIIIVDLNGNVLADAEIDSECTFDQYVSPDMNYIVIKILDVVKLYDINLDQVFEVCSDARFFSKPIFYDDKFYFQTWGGCKFYDLSLGTLDSLDIQGEICFINEDIIISEDNELIRITDSNLNIINSVLVQDCNFYGSLQTYKDSLFYFYGENDLVDDEGAVYQVDFNNLLIEKTTNLGEDHFITYINSFH